MMQQQQRNSIYIFLLISGCTLLSCCFDGSYANCQLKEVPEAELQVDTGARAAREYLRFIEVLRPRLGPVSFHHVPVLPRQQRDPTIWLDVVLTTGTRRTKVRLRGDNLYVVGYCMEQTNQWWEFGINNPSNPPPRLIDGSTFLGFDGSYGNMANAANQLVADINLGQQAIIGAVNGLATSPPGTNRAKFLIILVQMISESIRFKKISDHLYTHYDANLKPPAWMPGLVTKWGYLSDELRAVEADLTYRFKPVNVTDPANPRGQPLIIIDTAAKAREIIGIIKGPPPMAGVDQDDEQLLPLLPQGRPLAEVFSERVVDGEDPPASDLYGTNDQRLLGFAQA